MEQNEIDVIEEIAEIQDENGNDLTDWKAEALKNQGIAKRLKTKLEKAKEKPEPEKEVPKEVKKGFDYAEKAYLKAEGIPKEHWDYAFEVMQNTGKSLEDVLESKWFQAEIKEKTELKKSEDALPKETKRGGNATRDTVDYWLAKDELPPIDQPDLRRKVVNERIKRRGDGSKFTTRPVV